MKKPSRASVPLSAGSGSGSTHVCLELGWEVAGAVEPAVGLGVGVRPAAARDGLPVEVVLYVGGHQAEHYNEGAHLVWRGNFFFRGLNKWSLTRQSR